MRFAVLCLVVSACQSAQVTHPISSSVPRQPEPYHPRGRVVITDTKIELLDRIGFFGGSATITPESVRQLDALAETLEANNSIARLEVWAYAKEVPEMFQQPLSDQRARRLVDYLVKRGVDRRRLQPVGITPAPPGTDNHPTFVVFWR